MPESQFAGPTPGPTIVALLSAYRAGSITPAEVVETVLLRVAERGDDGVWITVAEREQLLARAAELTDSCSPELPLYGIPFGVKDSIDVTGWPTTLACPSYAYTATTTAPVVQAILDAGGILIGKTNLDQFATGLNGTRTPYPVPRSVYGADLISGGSSSGSVLAVALGEVPFCVATDTAGSGRVPPALNGVPGFKPSRGLISTVGLVPACRSLDCVSLIASDIHDMRTVFDIVAGMDARDAWSRPRRVVADPLAGVVIGLPDPAELAFFGDAPMSAGHLAARDRLAEAFETFGVPPLAPFTAAGELLYQGPWVAERLLEFGEFLETDPTDLVPVVADIIRSGAEYDALDVFRAQYRLAELKAEVTLLFESMDVLILPTIGTTFTVDEVLSDPIATNTKLGHYTHFGNLLDLCAAAVPAGITGDGRPVSLMVLGPALSDDVVLAVAARIESLFPGADRPVVIDWLAQPAAVGVAAG